MLAAYEGRPRVLYTTVGEEGMNVRRCTRVVQFDPVVASGAFDAQRAGRAARRKEGLGASDCVVLLSPKERAERMQSSARAYTADVFGQAWETLAPPAGSGGAFADPAGEAAAALAASYGGTRDPLAVREAEARAAAQAARPRNFQKEVLKACNAIKRGGGTRMGGVPPPKKAARTKGAAAAAEPPRAAPRKRKAKA